MKESQKDVLLEQVRRKIDDRIAIEQFKQDYSSIYNEIIEACANCKDGREFILEDYILIPEDLHCYILAIDNLKLIRIIAKGTYCSISIFKKEIQCKIAYVLYELEDNIICYQFKGEI